MKIELIGTSGVDASLLGLGLSYGLTSEYSSMYYVPEETKKRLYQIAGKLACKGGGEDKFLRQIVYWWDITAPSYWWPQFDQYKVGTVTQSESKMHSLLKRPFSPDDFEIEWMPGYRKLVDQFMPEVDEDAEEWAKVPDYPAVYASNQGRVKRLAYTATDGRFFKERILTNIVQQDGYMHSVFLDKGKRVQVPTHRVIALAFIPNPDNKPFVNHIDGNKQNNKPKNLEWVTAKENVQHAIDNGLASTGLGGYAGKFSEEERDDILARWNSGETMRAISRDLGVSHSLVGSLVHGRYKYLEPKKSEFNWFCKNIIEPLNELREAYLATKDNELWLQILNMLPQSYRQRRVCSMNLAVMKNIYHQRKHHKLGQWHLVCQAFVDATPGFLQGIYDEADKRQ